MRSVQYVCSLSFIDPLPVITMYQYVILLGGLFKSLMKRARLSKATSK